MCYVMAEDIVSAIDNKINFCFRVVFNADVLQAFLTSQEAKMIERSVAKEERLTREQNDLEAEIMELTRIATVKVRYSLIPPSVFHC